MAQGAKLWVPLDMNGKQITNGAAAVNPTDIPIFSQVPGAAAVSSVFTRTGAVVAANGDYTAAQVGALAATAAAGGDLTGNYPSPTLAAGVGTHKLFDSTLGADTASIDTGAGGISGAYDVLEVWIIARTDDAATTGTVSAIVNNDTSSIYDLQRMTGANISVSTASALAQAAWLWTARGATSGAGYASVFRITFPGYAQTTFNKTGEFVASSPDTAATQSRIESFALGYRSTTAISRMKIAAAGAAKLKAGSRLLIYGR